MRNKNSSKFLFVQSGHAIPSLSSGNHWWNFAHLDENEQINGNVEQTFGLFDKTSIDFGGKGSGIHPSLNQYPFITNFMNMILVVFGWLQLRALNLRALYRYILSIPDCFSYYHLLLILIYMCHYLWKMLHLHLLWHPPVASLACIDGANPLNWFVKTRVLECLIWN